ncbi:MAG: OmpH family outer membrane protein [Holosporales bacterium]|jgi:Skp family chaperone for outer membrane proteins|nr:OmpH family outer membrane protein [Holosporales bacterium]
MLRRNLFISIAAIAILALTAILLLQYFLKSNFVTNPNFNATKFAMLNGETLKSKAKCFKAHGKIAEKFSDILSRMREFEKSIKSEYEKVKNDSKLSQKQKVMELTKIEAKWGDMSTKYNAEIQEVRNTDLKFSEIVQAKLNDIIESIAKTAGISAVVNSGNRDFTYVFYSSKDIDITDLVIKRLDEELPDINLDEVKK